MAHAHPHSGAPSYGHYQQPTILPPSMTTYPPTTPSYHYTYGAPVTTAAHHPGHYSHPMALPTMTQAQPSAPAATYAPHTPDTSGQVAPPNHKPKLTGTVWEDEGTVCFQVEVRGICVARREDNCFINGTKLLNVANMTRGRRDGILKSEKTRNVIKIGPMHLKGVWIPFERALEFANKEKITESLYPLFVSNISPLLAPHFNHLQPGRRNEAQPGQSQALTTPQSSTAPAPAQLPSTQSMSNSVTNGQSTQPVSSQTPSSRPELSRAHTFPTPPTSATSVAGTSQSGAQYGWDTTNGSALQVDTGINHDVKSLPTTPTTSSPEHHVQSVQYPSNQGYDASRPVYSAPHQNSQYATNQSLSVQPYGQMQPPRKNEVMQHERDFPSHGYANSGYAYGDNTASPDVKNSPHNSGSGRATPRSRGSQQANWQTGYGTPQRQIPSSNLAYVIGDNASNGYSYTNGTPPSSKRGREPDDEDYSTDVKKRKMGREGSAGLSRPRSSLVQRQ